MAVIRIIYRTSPFDLGPRHTENATSFFLFFFFFFFSATVRNKIELILARTGLERFAAEVYEKENHCVEPWAVAV
jgi:hypothetical protein